MKSILMYVCSLVGRLDGLSLSEHLLIPFAYRKATYIRKSIIQYTYSKTLSTKHNYHKGQKMTTAKTTKRCWRKELINKIPQI